MHELEKENFRTVIKPVKYNFDINYKSNLMFIGSCFTESIGEELKTSKFNIDINPFGILYNPISVKNSLNFLIENKRFSENDIFYFNERWHSFYHHSRFSASEKKQMLSSVNQRTEESSDLLKNADFLFITFGTAWVYEHRETDEIVSNCHKVPAKNFKRRILTIDEITNAYYALSEKIMKFNPDLKIIFTISPVRHLKDGFYENNLSKSVLRLAIDKLINVYSNCFYFPAYEILTDDLRDYRFYKSDLLHPNKTAVDYIFNFFKSSFISDDTLKILNEIRKIIRSKNHKPFNLNSEEYKKFVKSNIKSIEKLTDKYDYINLVEELVFFENKL